MCYSVQHIDVFSVIGTAKAVCVTTNGVVKSSGLLVMGAGVAKDFATAYPELPANLGHKVSTHGNHVYLGAIVNNTCILSFPTKQDYRNKSDLNLIIASAKRLVKWCNANHITGANSVYIPFPGIGKGGLDKQLVADSLVDILDNRFVLCIK